MQKESQWKHSSRRLIIVLAGVAAVAFTSCGDKTRTNETQANAPTERRVVEGVWMQAKTPEDFERIIPQGMRAFSLSLPESNLPENESFYPGCRVDVVAERKLQEGDPAGSVVSMIILRDIRVLAVWGPSRRSDKIDVVLLVRPQEVERLAVAAESPGVSLRLRTALTKSPQSGPQLSQQQ